MKQIHAIHAITAILLTLQKIGGNIFSVHDVTTDIRECVNNDEYILDNDGDGTIVSHSDIRYYFTELYINGLLSDYTRTHNVSGYYEYQHNSALVPMTTYTPPAPLPTALPDVKAVSAASNFPMDVQKKMYAYIKNNGPVTMKQIQSRLKGYPYTCEQIKDFLDRLALIDTSISGLPTSQNKTVKF